MINKIRFFGGELKRSMLFVIVVTLQVAISIFLLNLTLTEAYASTVETKYYSKQVAENSCVIFNQGSYFGSTEVGELNKLIDLKDLATTCSIGDIEFRYLDLNGKEQISYNFSIGIATPALMKNFNTFNTKIKPGNSKGYYEAQSKEASNKYKVGETYDINYQTSDGSSVKSIKIKIVGASKETDYFYNFESDISRGEIVHPYIPFEILICDELFAYEYAELTAGIFINEELPSYYESFGFTAKTVQQLYDDYKLINLENSRITAYMASILVLYTFISTFCIYLIDVYKADRKRAVNYICGVTPSSQLIVEMIKMAFIFVVAFIPNLVISIILGAESLYNAMGGNMVTVPYAFASTGIMLAVYMLAVVVGMVKYIKTKPIQIINNIH